MSVLTDSRGLDVLEQPAPALPCLNLLPPEIVERRRVRSVQLAVAGALAATLGVVGWLTAGAAGAVQDADRQLRTAGARGAVLQAESAQYAGVLTVHQRADAASATVARAMAEEVRYSKLLDDLSRTVPDDVWLEDVTFAQTPAATAVSTSGGAGTGGGIGTVTFTGVALSYEDVVAWLEALATSPGYADPSLSRSTAGRVGDRRTVSFTSAVTLTPAALSGRDAPSATGG